MLFPDVLISSQISMSDLMGTSTYGNVIKKAYICTRYSSKMKPGDIVVFYASKSIKSIVCIGVVDDAFKANELDSCDAYKKVVKRRTVYEDSYLENAYQKGFFTILFKYYTKLDKYIKLEDSYLSVVESIKHAGYANEVDVEIGFVDSETINAENAKEKLEKFDGIIVPGGFGNRGIEGKIQTVKYARENNVPFLGICLGMQMAVIEFARDVLDLKDADSVEFNPDTKNPVIHIMEDQKNITKKGGTMRLGAYPCVLEKGTLASNLYGSEEISERHRHRYEFNNDYKKKMEEKKMVFSGTSPDGNLVEIVEIKNHPYFIAVQFHPEFKSRPDRPQPLFVGLVKATKNRI